MKEQILKNMMDDDDTIVVDAPNEAGGIDAQGGIGGDDDFVAEAPMTESKAGSRALYAFLYLIALLSGTGTALISAVTYGVASLGSAPGDPKELEALMENGEWGSWGWIAKFTGSHAQADYISRNLTIIAILGIVAVAAVIGLCVLAGRFASAGRFGREAGGIRMNWFDRLWSELHIAAACGAAAAAVFTAVPVGRMANWTNRIGLFDLSGVYAPIEADNYIYGISNTSVFWYCTTGIAACLFITVVCFVSTIKKIKAHELIHCSLCGKLLSLLGRSASHAGHGVAIAGKGIAKAGQNIASKNKSAVRSFTIPSETDRRAARKLTLKYILIAVVLIFFPAATMPFTDDYGALVFFSLVSSVIAAVLIRRKVGKLAEIRAGVIEVKSGNLSHKITVREDENGPETDLDQLASDINHISEATNAAVQSEIRNQRLKTDLISNVSHDLKTPLTSMISYLDIIDKEGLDSPDAPAHLAIVREKTDRLKTLTEELFEAAKASSGNIPCEIEDIDVAALIDQSLAELGDRLARKKLKIRKNIRTENTIVRADGKLLYRVFENLLSNISKYALDRSRVYIDVTEPASAPSKLLIEVKNISKEELNISPDELMERFTRGDSSRNTEGSGLGLAIAKDLTTLMGGVFEIKIDGDMFKACVMLDRA